MNTALLTEPHNFKDGDSVVVYDRDNDAKSYNGTIYKIINNPLNKYINDYKNIYVDYFYIQFSEDDYHKLLMRGLDIILNHQLVVLGNVVRDRSGKIERLYTQQPFVDETEINIRNVNAMLVWRVAFDIKYA